MRKKGTSKTNVIHPYRVEMLPKVVVISLTPYLLLRASFKRPLLSIELAISDIDGNMSLFSFQFADYLFNLH